MERNPIKKEPYKHRAYKQGILIAGEKRRPKEPKGPELGFEPRKEELEWDAQFQGACILGRRLPCGTAS